jgi:methionyl-tRNA formyltransferase
VALAAQDDAASTLAPPLEKDDGRLDFTQPARAVSARARGVDPWPGATAVLDGETVKLFRPRVVPAGALESARVAAAPGTVLRADGDGLVIACGDGAVAFGELQLPGRKRLPIGVVLNGHAIEPGTRLG